MTAATRKTVRPRGRIEKPGSTRTPSRGRIANRDTNTTPRAPRGRGKTRRPHAISPDRAQLASQALEAKLLEEAHPNPKDSPGTSNVARVYNEIYESKPLSLSFVDHGHLESSPDTVTITLNLMDFMLVEANWNPALSQNKLAASCFLFASRITGLANEAGDIAISFEYENQANASAWATWITTMGPNAANHFTMQARAAQALRVSAEDVELGYEILWEMREMMDELVGKFSTQLESLQVPAGYRQVLQEEQEQQHSKADVEETVDRQEEEAEAVQQPPVDGGNEETNPAATEDDLLVDNPELVELDDFETSVEDFGS
ncbi:hypothetical protein Slin14017_G020740 [Septoria linicola]|nr:hypothetical protein Slin14017_G020740 [Septoria linicola]